MRSLKFKNLFSVISQKSGFTESQVELVNKVLWKSTRESLSGLVDSKIMVPYLGIFNIKRKDVKERINFLRLITSGPVKEGFKQQQIRVNTINDLEKLERVNLKIETEHARKQIYRTKT